MKIRALLIMLCAAFCWSGWAQSDTTTVEPARSIYAGLRNNRYISVGYQDRHWSVGVENTLFIRNLDEQYIRAMGGFRCATGVWGVDFESEAFVGANYKGRFYDMGLKVQLGKEWSRIKVVAGVMPLYDSMLGYTTCYTVNAACRIIQEASLVLDVTNVPEYRMPEHRIVPGLLFRAKKLWVRPEVSIPLNDNIQFTRVLVSFRYDFTLR